MIWIQEEKNYETNDRLPYWNIYKLRRVERKQVTIRGIYGNALNYNKLVVWIMQIKVVII